MVAQPVGAMRLVLPPTDRMGCHNYTLPPRAAGALPYAVVALRGSCSFREKALKASAAGAAVLIVSNTVRALYAAQAGSMALVDPCVADCGQGLRRMTNVTADAAYAGIPLPVPSCASQLGVVTAVQPEAAEPYHVCCVLDSPLGMSGATLWREACARPFALIQCPRCAGYRYERARCAGVLHRDPRRAAAGGAGGGGNGGAARHMHSARHLAPVCTALRLYPLLCDCVRCPVTVAGRPYCPLRNRSVCCSALTRLAQFSGVKPSVDGASVVILCVAVATLVVGAYCATRIDVRMAGRRASSRIAGQGGSSDETSDALQPVHMSVGNALCFLVMACVMLVGLFFLLKAGAAVVIMVRGAHCASALLLAARRCTSCTRWLWCAAAVHHRAVRAGREPSHQRHLAGAAVALALPATQAHSLHGAPASPRLPPRTHVTLGCR